MLFCSCLRRGWIALSGFKYARETPACQSHGSGMCVRIRSALELTDHCRSMIQCLPEDRRRQPNPSHCGIRHGTVEALYSSINADLREAVSEEYDGGRAVLRVAERCARMDS